ncbi:MAG: thermonuclease family protein [Thermodesulfobacteriota bacterium]|nr:thermonuclease family protein [Thermodesulfobacteriota bacterium]
MKEYIRWPLVVLVVLLLALLFHWAKAMDLKEVVRVFDGDTIEIFGGDRIRLIGVDAPEIESRYGQAEPFGNKSRRYLKQMIGGEKVRLVSGPQARDKYGRRLCYVYLDDTLVNGRIIQDGWARAYTRFSFRYRELFVSYEKKARAQGKGMWKE